MERFESQLQARLAREQLRWQRREARWARRQLKLDLRSVKPVDSVAVEGVKKSLTIKVPVYKKAKPKKKIEKPAREGNKFIRRRSRLAKSKAGRETSLRPKRKRRRFLKGARPLRKKIEKPVVVKPIKKRPKPERIYKERKVKEPVEIKTEIYKEPRIEKPEVEIPEVREREVTVEEKPTEEAVKLTTKPVRYRCMMCGTISTGPGICCGKEMEECG